MADIIPIQTNDDAIAALAVYLDAAQKGDLHGFTIVLDGAYSCHGEVTPAVQYAYLGKAQELMLAYLDDEDEG